MMDVKPTIIGLIPQNTIVIAVDPGKLLGISDTCKMDLQLELSGTVPATAGIRLFIVNNDIYRFTDGNTEIRLTCQMTALSQKVKPDFRVRSIKHFSKKAPDLLLAVFAWEVNTGEDMADSHGGRFPVTITGGVMNFTKFK